MFRSSAHVTTTVPSPGAACSPPAGGLAESPLLPQPFNADNASSAAATCFKRIIVPRIAVAGATPATGKKSRAPHTQAPPRTISPVPDGTLRRCGSRQRLEVDPNRQPNRARLGRMEVAIGNRRRFACEPRFVVVLDVLDLALEQVQHIERELDAFVEAPAGARVQKRRRVRTHRVVFDQRPRTEIT